MWFVEDLHFPVQRIEHSQHTLKACIVFATREGDRVFRWFVAHAALDVDRGRGTGSIGCRLRLELRVPLLIQMAVLVLVLVLVLVVGLVMLNLALQSSIGSARCDLLPRIYSFFSFDALHFHRWHCLCFLFIFCPMSTCSYLSMVDDVRATRGPKSGSQEVTFIG